MNSIDQQVKRLHLKAGGALDDRVHADIDKALANAQTTISLTIGRTRMISSFTKLAVAAAVVLAGLLGLNILSGPHGGVAWAAIPDHVKAIDTFMFRLTIVVRDEEEEDEEDKESRAQFTFYVSERYGFRMDIRGDETVVSWYVPPEGDTLTMVIPREKKWSKTPLPPEERDKMPEEYEDPAQYVKEFMARPYKKLGRSVIDGVEVEGIEVTDPPVDTKWTHGSSSGNPATDPPTKSGKLANSIGRMWVDVQTQLPMRIEIEGTADENTVRFLMEFKWSEAVDPKVFEPNIPSDYTPLGQ